MNALLHVLRLGFLRQQHGDIRILEPQIAQDSFETQVVAYGALPTWRR